MWESYFHNLSIEKVWSGIDFTSRRTKKFTVAHVFLYDFRINYNLHCYCCEIRRKLKYFVIILQKMTGKVMQQSDLWVTTDVKTTAAEQRYKFYQVFDYIAELFWLMNAWQKFGGGQLPFVDNFCRNWDCLLMEIWLIVVNTWNKFNLWYNVRIIVCMKWILPRQKNG